MGRIARVLEEEEKEGKRKGGRERTRKEARREATKTMRRKLDGVREKVQKEGEGASKREWVSEREREIKREREKEREVANAIDLPSHPAQRERSGA